MSEATLQDLVSLFDSIDQHHAMVEERLRDTGMNPDTVIAHSVAKYWDALEKLAAE